jgi:acylphosphatase
VSQPGEPTRQEILFDGRVQGVGFRFTAWQIAQRFRVVGYVRNLPDGRVLLVAEAAADEIERFVAAVSAEMARYIRGVNRKTCPATGEFADFDVRH